MGRKLTVGEFIERSKKIHGDNYDYNLVEYQGKDKKVKIICKDHGIFEQRPNSHMRGNGCNKCAIDNSKHTIESLISKFNLIHDFKYDYSLIKNIENLNSIKLSIICPTHGEFNQTFVNHIQKCGCPKCANEKSKYTIDIVKRRFTNIHGDKYDYGLFKNYRGIKDIITIICPKHGEFSQEIRSHIQGCGCQKCANDIIRMKGDEFIKRANIIHGNSYSYGTMNYINNLTKIEIICPDHGSFWQTPSSHLHQKAKCPKCANHISKPEIEVQDFVKSLGFKIITNSRKILNGKELDIYIPSLKKAIEFNGTYWHYDKTNPNCKPSCYHSTKSKLCKSKNINLLHLREDLWNRNKQKMKKVIHKFLEYEK